MDGEMRDFTMVRRFTRFHLRDTGFQPVAVLIDERELWERLRKRGVQMVIYDHKSGRCFTPKRQVFPAIQH